MGFGRQLAEYRIQQWQEKYIPYKERKKWIQRKADQITPWSPKSPSMTNKDSLYGTLKMNLLSNQDSQYLRKFDSDDAELSQARMEFLDNINEDVTMVEEHFSHELSLFADRLLEVGKSATALIVEKENLILAEVDDEGGGNARVRFDSPRTRKETEAYLESIDDHLDRLKRILVGLWDGFDRLADFANMNLMGLARLFQKRDRIWGVKLARKEFPPYKQRIRALKVHEDTERLMRVYFSKIVRALNQNDEGADDFDYVELHVSKAFYRARSTGIENKTKQEHKLAWVLFGMLLVLVLDLLLLFWLSPRNPDFRELWEAAIPSIAPPWRLCLVFCSISLGLGVVCHLWSRYSINWKFLLEVDTDCTINAVTFMALGGVQSAIWVIGMITLLADFKFGVLFGYREYDPWHGYIQLALQLAVLFLLPVGALGWKERKALLASVGRIIKTIFVVPRNVSFFDNLVADFLTSLVKPMVDVYHVLYLVGVLTLFSTDSDAKAPPAIAIVAFLTATLPLLVRVNQCRFKISTKRGKSMTNEINIGKFLLGMLVVVVTNSSSVFRYMEVSAYGERLIWVLLYIGASLFNLWWDVREDWGLAPDADHFFRENSKILFPQAIYGNAVLIDTIGRLTWALTLMPVRVMFRDELSTAAEELVVVIVTLMEILRRLTWMVVKLETEHLTNSSFYRAVLWVPNPSQTIMKAEGVETPLR